MNFEPSELHRWYEQMKISEVESVVESLDYKERLTYWETLAHNLTVSCRGVWSDDHYTDSEKVEGMKSINEVLHRVTARIFVDRKKTQEWTDTDLFLCIRSWASKSPRTKGHIAWALTASLPRKGEG